MAFWRSRKEVPSSLDSDDFAAHLKFPGRKRTATQLINSQERSPSPYSRPPARCGFVDEMPRKKKSFDHSFMKRQRSSEASDATDSYDGDMVDSKYSAARVNGDEKVSENKSLKNFLSRTQRTPQADTSTTKEKLGKHIARLNSQGPLRKVAVLSLSTDVEETKSTKRNEDSEPDSDDSSGQEDKHVPAKRLKSVSTKNARTPVKKGLSSNVKLPSLDTEEERSILGDIFAQWQREMNGKANRVARKKPTERPISVASSEETAVKPVLSAPAPPVVLDGIKRGRIPIVTSSVIINASASSSSNTVAKASPPSVSVAAGPVSQPGSSTPSSKYLDLAQILTALPDDANWRVDHVDAARAQGRYLQRRESNAKKLDVCTRCAVSRYEFPCHCRSLPCSLCHGTDHQKERCPNRDVVWAQTCSRCSKPGHTDIICPEIWRQFHSTTTMKDPDPGPPRKKISNWSCANCGQAHPSHSCKKNTAEFRAANAFPTYRISRYDTLDSYLSGFDGSPFDLFHQTLSEEDHHAPETDAQVISPGSKKKKSPIKRRWRRSEKK